MKQSCKIWNFFRYYISLQKALDFWIFLDFKCLDKGCTAYKWSLCGSLVVPQSRYMQQLANTVIRCNFKIQAVGQICWSHGGPTAGLDEGLAKPPQENADRKLWNTQSYKQKNSKPLQQHTRSVPVGWHERRASRVHLQFVLHWHMALECVGLCTKVFLSVQRLSADLADNWVRG